MVVRKKLVLNLEFVAFTLQCFLPDDGVLANLKVELGLCLATEWTRGLSTSHGNRVDQGLSTTADGYRVRSAVIYVYC